jgi:hypothetical protein
MESEEGKKIKITADMSKLSCNELILSVDDNESIEKVIFNLVKGCKNKVYADGNASMSWERLRQV